MSKDLRERLMGFVSLTSGCVALAKWHGHHDSNPCARYMLTSEPIKTPANSMKW